MVPNTWFWELVVGAPLAPASHSRKTPAGQASGYKREEVDPLSAGKSDRIFELPDDRHLRIGEALKGRPVMGVPAD